MSYLFPTLNSNNQLSFGQTVTPKCTNNLFRMKDKINTSRISTKQGVIVNMKWRCKGRRPLHGSPKLRHKFKELNKLNNQIEKMSVMNTSTQPLVMAPLVGIPPSSCYSRGSNNTNFCTGLYKLVGDLHGGPLWSKLLSAILTRTFLTRPSSSGSTSSRCAIFQQFGGIPSSLIMTMLSSWRLLCLVYHFCFSSSDWIYSLLHLVRN